MESNNKNNNNFANFNHHNSIDNHKLVIHQYKNKLTAIIEKEPIFVLIGATGSGKTTQIPQWCLSSSHAKSKLIFVCELFVPYQLLFFFACLLSIM